MDSLILTVMLTLPIPGPVVCSDDAWRFPPDPVIKEARERGEMYRANLLVLMSIDTIHPGPPLAWKESYEADLAWAELWKVRPYGPDQQPAWAIPPFQKCHINLANLRCMIGPWAYSVGRMPDLCPPWAFTPVDD